MFSIIFLQKHCKGSPYNQPIGVFYNFLTKHCEGSPYNQPIGVFYNFLTLRGESCECWTFCVSYGCLIDVLAIKYLVIVHLIGCKGRSSAPTDYSKQPCRLSTGPDSRAPGQSFKPYARKSCLWNRTECCQGKLCTTCQMVFFSPFHPFSWFWCRASGNVVTYVFFSCIHQTPIINKTCRHFDNVVPFMVWISFFLSVYCLTSLLANISLEYNNSSNFVSTGTL